MQAFCRIYRTEVANLIERGREVLLVGRGRRMGRSPSYSAMSSSPLQPMHLSYQMRKLGTWQKNVEARVELKILEEVGEIVGPKAFHPSFDDD